MAQRQALEKNFKPFIKLFKSMAQRKDITSEDDDDDGVKTEEEHTFRIPTKRSRMPNNRY